MMLLIEKNLAAVTCVYSGNLAPCPRLSTLLQDDLEGATRDV